MNRPLAALAAWLAVLPAASAVGLYAAGFLPLWLALGGLILVGLWSLALATVLVRDLTRFGTRIGAAGTGREAAIVTPGLTGLASVIRQTIAAEHRARPIATSDPSVSQRLLERLPDALFQLEGPPGARRVVWRNPAAAAGYGGEEQALLRHPALRAALLELEAGDGPIRTSFALAAPIPRDLDATIIRIGGVAPSAEIYLLLTDRSRERGLDRMRADFVANASHELRTPLTSLIGFIETLQGPALGDVQALPQFLAIMAEQAARMQRLIADLLNLSHIEMTEHQPPSDIIAIAPLLRQVAGFMEPVLREAGTVLRMDIPDDLPPLRADAGQLTQLFCNLIDNAVKYGGLKHPKGDLAVELSAVATPGLQNPQPGVLVRVVDNGPGIAREHLPRLTERFYRADRGRSRAIGGTVGGTGLGLAIVKHVISRHRGRLTIESVEGKGTTCLVWLPSSPVAERPSA